MLKELQALGLDVKVLGENQQEVEIMETVDYGETDIRSVIEGDRGYKREENSFGSYGFSQQEISGDEFVDVQESEDEDLVDVDDSFDDDVE